MTRTILVTGGTGYLGGRIVKALAQEARFNVRIATHRPISTLATWTKEHSVASFDASRPGEMRQACSAVDAVIHLAALNEEESRNQPNQALAVNVGGTLSLLQAAESCGVQRFLFFSTAHVYGTPLGGHITEHSLTRPLQPYAITHRAAEDFVLAAQSQRRIAGCVYRVSNGFGAPADPNIDRWNLLVNDLCRQAATCGKLILRTSGQQQRNFIAISDISRAVIHFLDMDSERMGNGLFNVGGRQSYSVLQMAELVSQRCGRVLGFRPDVEHAPESQEVSETLHYGIDKLSAIGFVPHDDFDSEIDNTLRVCQATFQRPS